MQKKQHKVQTLLDAIPHIKKNFMEKLLLLNMVVLHKLVQN